MKEIAYNQNKVIVLHRKLDTWEGESKVIKGIRQEKQLVHGFGMHADTENMHAQL